MSARDCPECVSGKHGNCDGSAWDLEVDLPGVCPCWAHGHHGAGDDEEPAGVCLPCQAGDHELCDWTAEVGDPCACLAAGHDEDTRDVVDGRLVEDHAGAAVVLSAIAAASAAAAVRAATSSRDARGRR